MRSGAGLRRVDRVSVAVRDGRIAALAPDARAPDGARVIDLDGALLLPGFVDAHTHLGWAAEGLWRVNWSDVAERAAALERVLAVMRRIDPGFWLTGGAWHRERLADTALPTRADLDAITGAAPLFLVSEDQAVAVANSAALQLFRIDERTADPPASRIERDEMGVPTGRLHGRIARGRLTAEVVPPRDRYRQLAELRAAVRELHGHGVTEVHDIATYPTSGPTPLTFQERGFSDATLYEELADRGELRLRVGVRPYLGRWADIAARTGATHELVRCHGLKLIIDNGRFSEDTVDAGYEFRYPGFDTTLEWMRQADRAGFDVTLHGLGDLAVTEALDLFQRVSTSEPPRARRPRLVHARRVAPDDIAHIARLGILVEAQPWDLLEQMPLMSARFTRVFLETAYPYAALLGAGVRVAFSSDWRITPQRSDLADMDPLLAMRAAVTRLPLDDDEPWQPEQRISVADAIRCYTEHPAWADRAEDRRGTIRVGNDADLVALTHDIVADADELPDARVRLTVVAGEVVFEA